MSGYIIDPNAEATANAVAFNALKNFEMQAMQQLGSGLDRTYNAVWSPPAPATTPGVVELCGTTFLARCMMHYTLGSQVLAQEAANGLDSARHPWAIKQQDGSYLPGTPAAWVVTPVLDGNGNPTGAAAVTPAS